MPIRIKCPRCQTILGVKDTLAGKKANCPKCRQLLTIPVPKPKPALVDVAPVPAPEDLEALAMSTFADEPPPAPKAASDRFVEFECAFCMEMVKVNADLAGKQTPCPNPECRRIIKVPLPKEDKPKDWRTTNPRGPSGAINKDPVQPEGAWSSAQKTRVSTESLLEANALPVKKEPIPVVRWAVRGGVALALSIALIVGAFTMLGRMAENRIQGSVDSALVYVEPEARLMGEPAASIYRGAGQFYLFRKEPAKAMAQFVKARARIPAISQGPGEKVKNDAERDLVLIELALAMIELTGPGMGGSGDRKVESEDVMKELQMILPLLTSTESNQTALRTLTMRLIALDNLELAQGLVNLDELPAPPTPEKKDAADADAKDTQPKAPVSTQPMNALLAQTIAFMYQARQTDKLTGALASPIGKGSEVYVEPAVRLGHAEGNARVGKFEDARKIANHSGDAQNRFEAHCGIALVAVAMQQPAEAKMSAQEALTAWHDTKKSGKDPSDWLTIELVRACARSEMIREARDLIAALAEKTPAKLRALMQREVFLAELDATPGPVEPAVLDAAVTDKNTLGYGLALEQLARHNTSAGQQGQMQALVDALEEQNRPFGQIGIAEGLVEPKK